jgi:hypothetical protein
MNVRFVTDQLPTSNTSAQTSALQPNRSLLSQIWNLLIRVLSEDTELKVVQKCDRFGRTHWEIRDPATQQFVSLSSESEARTWIEQHRHLGDRY